MLETISAEWLLMVTLFHSLLVLLRYLTDTDAVVNTQPCGTQGLGHTQSDIMKCAGNISHIITSTLVPSKTVSAIYMASSTTTLSIPLSPPLATSNTTMLDSQGETTKSQLQTSRPVPIVWVYILVGVHTFLHYNHCPNDSLHWTVPQQKQNKGFYQE